METFAEGLGALGGTFFRWSAVTFLIVNGGFALAFFLTRDRGLVNRWTSRIVATNMFLLATGLGVPVLTLALRTVVKAVAATTQPTEVRLNAK